MPRSRNDDCHYEEVEHFGITVQLKQIEPDGNLYVEHRHFDRRYRKSLGTKDLEKARRWSREHCQEIALKKEGGALGAAVRSNDLTLGELFDAFRERGLPEYKKTKSRGYCTALSRAMDLLEAAWGRGLPVDHIDQQKINDFVELREKKGLTAKRNGQRRTYAPTGRQATRDDLKQLSTICTWGQKQRCEGDWLMAGVHPMDRVDMPDRTPDSRVSRPLADQERYEATLEFADQIGKTEQHLGRQVLPMLLALARHTGRRLQALRCLHRRDVCLDRAAIESALRRDQAPVGRAQAWPHGAIHWRAGPNKQSYSSVIPMNRPLHVAVERYLEETWPALMKRQAGDQWRDQVNPSEAPLFPSPSSPRPISPTTPLEWLNEAEALARRAGRAGAPPAEVDHDGFHAYRRGWATERGHFSTDEAQKATRVAGSWAHKGDTMSKVYLQVSPSALYRVVANDEPGKRKTGVVSFETLDRVLTRAVTQLTTGTAGQDLRDLPELDDEDRERLLWEHVRSAENLTDGADT